MTNTTHSVYQSGEKVITAGMYEVVGAGYAYNLDENTVQPFQPGDVFPDYVGRAVCWHLLRTIPEELPPEKPSGSQETMHTVWQPTEPKSR